MPFSQFCKRCESPCCIFYGYLDGLFLAEYEHTMFKQHFDKNNGDSCSEKIDNFYSVGLTGRCPFQSEEKPFLCTIWENRPADCRIFPIYIFPDKEILRFDISCDEISKIIAAINDPVKFNSFDLIKYIKGISTYMLENKVHADLLFEFEDSIPEKKSMSWNKWLRISRSVHGEIPINP